MMKFEECYPAEIVEWANSLPAPERCTALELNTARLLEDDSVIALGRGLIKRLHDVATREEANQMIFNFRTLIQDAVNYA